jgi:hypothetical protein
VIALFALAAVGVWSCRNPIEISCGPESCAVAPADGFTPMDISAGDGRLSVCAYSGCWEARAKPLRKRGRILFIADQARFSTSDSEDARADLTLVIDERDGAGFLMAAGFSHPLRCSKGVAP